MNDLLTSLPSREGHFLLESGYHTNVWITVDGLFVDPARVAPLVDRLADRLRPYGPSAVCGPFVGGAFLAQNLANALNARFFYAQPVAAQRTGDLFSATYQLPPELERRVRGQTCGPRR